MDARKPTKLVFSANDPAMRTRRGENRPEERRMLIKERLLACTSNENVVPVGASMKSDVLQQATAGLVAWKNRVRQSSMAPCGECEDNITSADSGHPSQHYESTTRHGLNYVVALGVITERLLLFFERCHAHFRADPAPDPSFLSDETADGDGIVPYFFVRSAGELDHARGEGHPEKVPIERLMAWHATDALTPIYADLPDVLDDDAAVCVQAASLVASGYDAYALTTHPGHHACEEHYGGYCFVNNAYNVCRTLECVHGKVPFLIDVDYHAGDGSASLLFGEKSLNTYDDCVRERSFASLHAPRDYPFLPSGLSWAVEVPAGATWEEYEPLLRESLARRVLPREASGSRNADTGAECGADCLVVSLGFDTLAGDPDARDGHRMALSPPDFAKMRAVLRETGLPMCAVQEGGYNLDDIPAAAEAFLLG